MADDLSLLFKLRADNADAKAKFADTQAALNRFTQSSKTDFSQLGKAGSDAFQQIAPSLGAFIQKIPIAGELLGKLAPAIQGAGAAAAGLGTQIAETAAGLGAVETASAEAGTALSLLAAPIAVLIVANIALAVAIAATVKGFFDLAAASAEGKAKLYDLSLQLGISVETLSALGKLATFTGGSIETISASLGIFQKNLESAQEPGNKFAKTLRGLNVDVTDTETTLRDTIRALAAMPAGYEQTAKALELFGRGGKGILAIIKETNGDLDGSIAKLKEYGLVASGDSAKAAHEFENSLALLDFQFTALKNTITKESIPALTEVVKSISEFINKNKELISDLGYLISVFVSLAAGFVTLHSRVLEAAHDIGSTFNPALKETAEFLKPIATLYEKIASAAAYIIGHPIPSAGSGNSTGAVGADAGTGRPAIPAIADFSRNFEAESIASLENQKRVAAAAKEQAKLDFDAGKLSREQELKAMIENGTKEINVQIELLERQKSLKRNELQFTTQTAEQRAANEQKLAADLLAIDSQIADKRAELEKFANEEIAKARKELVDATRAHNEALLALEDKNDQLRIRQIKQRLDAGLDSEEIAAFRIENIEEHALDRRRHFYIEERNLAGDNVIKQQAIVDKLADIEADRDAMLQKHTEERQARAQKESDTIDAIVQKQYARLINQVKIQENELAITHEEAAKQTLAIQVAGIDAQIYSAESQNKDTRLLYAERAQIIDAGNEVIRAGYNQDLEATRNYFEALAQIQRESAQLVIDLMVLNHSRRSDVIKADADLERKDEDARHKREIERLKALKADHIAVEAENERHRLANEKIDKKEKADLGKDKANPVSAFDQLGDAINENLSGEKFTAATAGLEAMKTAFSGLAEAVGSVVEAYVLYGKAGESVQQVTAQILASIAKQAAIKAVFELAEGLAALALAFFGVPNAGPSAAEHFAASAVYASIAGIAAVAGRAVAGDSFKQSSTASANASGSSSGSSSSGSSSPKPIDIGRRQGAHSNSGMPPIYLVGEFAEEHFRVRVANAVTRDQLKGGKIRQLDLNNGVLVQ